MPAGACALCSVPVGVHGGCPCLPETVLPQSWGLVEVGNCFPLAGVWSWPFPVSGGRRTPASVSLQLQLLRLSSPGLGAGLNIVFNVYGPHNLNLMKAALFDAPKSSPMSVYSQPCTNV